MNASLGLGFRDKSRLYVDETSTILLIADNKKGASLASQRALFCLP